MSLLPVIAGKKPRYRPGMVLKIVPPDGNLNVTHPSIVDAGEKWNGYRYWLALTPYPDGPRENPCIYASNDGLNWKLPPGGSNPIYTYAQAHAAGHDYNSDVHLIKVGEELWCYWRMVETSEHVETLCRKKSSDGRHWSESEVVMSRSGSRYTLTSPVYLQEQDGRFSLWVVEEQEVRELNGLIVRYESDDGIQFGNPQVCTLPARLSPWHIDVQRHDGYKMLVCRRPAQMESDHLVFLSSSDGLVWEGNTHSDFEHFTFGNRSYKSTFLPKGAGKYDLYALELENQTPRWRLLLYRDQVLPDPTRAHNLQKAIAGVDPYVMGDNFDRADGALGTAPTGHVWQATYGNPLIVDGMAGCNAQSLARVDSGLSDCVIEARLESAIAEAREAWICFRYGDNGRLRVGARNADKPGQTYQILYAERIFGGTTNIFSYANVNLGDYIGVRLRGSLIDIMHNSRVVATIEETFNLTETRHGIQLSNENSRMADFTIRRL